MAYRQIQCEMTIIYMKANRLVNVFMSFHFLVRRGQFRKRLDPEGSAS